MICDDAKEILFSKANYAKFLTIKRSFFPAILMLHISSRSWRVCHQKICQRPSGTAVCTFLLSVKGLIPIKHRFHFNSIAHDNDALDATVEGITPLPASQSPSISTPHTLRGIQLVPKFNRTTPDRVRIFVALFRVHEKKTDVVFSINMPLKTEKGEFSPEQQQPVAEAFVKAANSFKIVDFSLFAS